MYYNVTSDDSKHIKLVPQTADADSAQSALSAYAEKPSSDKSDCWTQPTGSHP